MSHPIPGTRIIFNIPWFLGEVLGNIFLQTLFLTYIFNLAHIFDLTYFKFNYIFNFKMYL